MARNITPLSMSAYANVGPCVVKDRLALVRAYRKGIHPSCLSRFFFLSLCTLINVQSLSSSLSVTVLASGVSLEKREREGCAPTRSEFQLPCWMPPPLRSSHEPRNPRAERVTTGGGVLAVVVLVLAVCAVSRRMFVRITRNGCRSQLRAAACHCGTNRSVTDGTA